MDFKRLEKNMVDVVKEQQIKLGYRSEMVYLYYPLSSVKHLLGVDEPTERLLEYLKGYTQSVKERYGEIMVSETENRFCFTIPPKGNDYIHEHMSAEEFLVDFIQTIRKHGVSFEEVLQVFHRHSNQVHVEKCSHGEFDYLIYFSDGIPDDYRYCIAIEPEHISYHRFTIEDYHEFEG